MKRVLGILLFFLLLTGLVSCNRKLGDVSEEKKYPELVLNNATYAFGRAGDHPITFTAKEVVIYSDLTELKEVSFNSPEAYLSGSCESVSVTQDNTFASMKGSVRLVKSDDNVIISCESLDWDNNDGSISCKDEVSLTYGNGTFIRAIGFKGHTKSNGYTFDKILEGWYKNEEK